MLYDKGKFMFLWNKLEIVTQCRWSKMEIMHTQQHLRQAMSPCTTKLVSWKERIQIKPCQGAV